MNWRLLFNSLLVSGLATALACAVGTLAALWLATRGESSRRVWLAFAITAAALPPFLVTNCWLALLGQTGALRPWLPLEIYSLPGAAGILASLLWPIPMLAAWSAWRRLEPVHFELEPSLRGAALGRWLLWPAARSALGQAALLTWVLALGNFAVPTILQVKVLPAELWLKLSTQLDLGGALAAGWPLIVTPLLALFVLPRLTARWPHTSAPAPAVLWRRQLGRPLVVVSGSATLAALFLSVGVPAAQLVTSSRTWAELPNLFRAAPGVIWNSFVFAALTATLGVAAGLASWRWRIGGVLWLPLLVPGVCLGTALAWVFNRPGLDFIYGSAAMVILGWGLRFAAPARQFPAEAMRWVDREVIESTGLAGARGWQLWRHGYGPQVMPAAAAAWYLTYLLCLWDVETLVLIQPPGGETLALRVFNLLHYGHHGQVNALCLALLALALAPLAAAAVVRRIARTRPAME